MDTSQTVTPPGSRFERDPSAVAAVRQRNLAQVLRVVHRLRNSTRSDIARITGLSRPAVTSLVAELGGLGFLTDTDRFVSAGRGRPRMGVAMERRTHSVVAVDLRVDRTVVEVVDLCGDVLQHRHVPVHDSADADAFVATLAATVRRLSAKAGVPVVGIGIAAPSYLGADGQPVVSSPYLTLSGTPLAGALSSALGATSLPVRMADVAQCAAIANSHALSSPVSGLLAHVQIGAGAGLGIAGMDGLRPSERNARVRIGHLPLDPDGPLCTCGARGCLDAVAGFPAFVELTRSLSVGSTPSIATMGDYCRDVSELALAGDRVAGDAIRNVATWAGRGAACVLNLIDPDRLTLGGYPLYLGELYRRSFLDAMGPYAPRADETVTAAALGDDAPALGAAILAMQPALDDPLQHPGVDSF